LRPCQQTTPKLSLASGVYQGMRYVILAALCLALLWLVLANSGVRNRISPKNQCLNQLRQIDGTIEEIRILRGLTTNSVISMDEIRKKLGFDPVCPEIGKLRIAKNGEESTCSVHVALGPAPGQR